MLGRVYLSIHLSELLSSAATARFRLHLNWEYIKHVGKFNTGSYRKKYISYFKQNREKKYFYMTKYVGVFKIYSLYETDFRLVNI
jgi:hypothetical protein